MNWADDRRLRKQALQVLWRAALRIEWRRRRELEADETEAVGSARDGFLGVTVERVGDEPF